MGTNSKTQIVTKLKTEVVTKLKQKRIVTKLKNIARIAKCCPENIISVVKYVNMLFPKVQGK